MYVEIKIASFINKHFFTVRSVVFHTIWFYLWFAFKLDVNMLTLVVSLEAIYITLFLGLGSKDHHERLKKQLKEKK